MTGTAPRVLATHLADDAALSAYRLETSGAGLVVGVSQENTYVVTTLFRPEPTRVTLFGGIACAQLLAFRALAHGARLTIQTTRPVVWTTFLHSARVQPHEADVLPPGAPVDRPVSASAPQLVIYDTGAANSEQLQDRAGWRASLTLRGEVTPWDFESLVGSDLVLLQALAPAEASMAASALGLEEEPQAWLSQIGPDVVALVSRGTLRWAMLSPTAVESALVQL